MRNNLEVYTQIDTLELYRKEVENVRYIKERHWLGRNNLS